MSSFKIETVGLLTDFIPPPKRYKIGELAQFTGLTRQTLHNYTRWGLIAESGWTPGGHRLYDETAFTRLATVMKLKDRYSVEQIREYLNGEAAAASAAAASAAA